MDDGEPGPRDHYFALGAGIRIESLREKHLSFLLFSMEKWHFSAVVY
jgi:hypothetical protein